MLGMFMCTGMNRSRETKFIQLRAGWEWSSGSTLPTGEAPGSTPDPYFHLIWFKVLSLLLLYSRFGACVEKSKRGA